MTSGAPSEVVSGEGGNAGAVITHDAPAATPISGQHWSKSYPELSGNPAIEKFESPATLANSYIELEKAIGRKGVLVPKEDAPQEEFTRFYESLGRPASASEYFQGWTPPEGLPWDRNQQQTMSEVFHKIGLTKTQAETIRDSYTAAQLQALNDSKRQLYEQAQESFVHLQEEYGTAFDGNVNLANRFGILLMGEDQWEKLMGKPFADGSTLGNHPDFIRAAVRMGAKMGEDNVFGMGSARVIGSTPQQAQEELNKLKSDKDFMKSLVEADHPEHSSAKRRYDNLYKQLYPPAL